MKSLSIGEAARQAGLNPSALRYYEREGLLRRPSRVSGRRRYEPAVVDTLRMIRLAQSAGFTLAEIRKLLRGFPDNATPSQRWHALAVDKLAEIDERMRELRQMKKTIERGLACGCRTLRECPVVSASD